jgi:1,4-alpha-glucan branching enzyme
MLKKKQVKENVKKKETNKAIPVKRKKVIFTIALPEAREVFVAGDFNGWNTQSHRLKKSFNGKWQLGMNLTPGRYEYRFLVDGQWLNDQKCRDLSPNPYGSENCVLIVKTK